MIGGAARRGAVASRERQKRRRRSRMRATLTADIRHRSTGTAKRAPMSPSPLAKFGSRPAAPPRPFHYRFAPLLVRSDDQSRAKEFPRNFALSSLPFYQLFVLSFFYLLLYQYYASLLPISPDPYHIYIPFRSFTSLLSLSLIHFTSFVSLFIY